MMKRTSLVFALLLALLMVMLPLQALAAAGEGVTPEDGDISITIPGGATTPAVYTVVFKDVDGTVLSMQNYNYGDEVTAPEAPSKAADETYTYEFTGWDKGVTTCLGNAVYTAVYEATYIDYTVKFVDDNGTEISTATYHYGDIVVVPADPTKAADENYTYEFAGWDKEVVAVTGDATYTATYTATKTEKPVVNAIVKQPEAVNTDTGNEVQFHVEVEGEVVSYKWEYRQIWKWFNTSMEGYNTDTLTVKATGARDGYDYRCLVTFADGTEIYSEPAELTVNTFITDVKNPNDQTVVLGYKGQFTAAAEGEDIKYTWQYKRPGDQGWYYTNMEGNNKPTVMIETTTARDGYQYRCEIKDVTGNITVYTEPATMRVLSFKSHPETQFSAVGNDVQFTVTTSVDEGFTYEWQYRRNETANWTNTTMPGYNTATLTVNATLARNGYQYRCVLTGSKNSKIESKTATLYVGEAVEISTQPQSVTVAAGEVATFTVEASNVYSYQWQYARKDSNTWYTTSAEGNQTATLNVTAKASNDGYQYRCKIMGLDGTENYTEVATLTVG